MAIQFKAASKKQAKLRAAICGPAGAGKTYSSLKIAKHLIGEPYKLPDGRPSRIVLIDTERSRSEKYADDFDFIHGPLPPDEASSMAFTEGLRQAEGIADVVILDSITHEWKWCLAEVDRIAPKYRNNTWSAFGEVTPKHDAFIDAIMGSSAHVFATMRSKMATVQEKDDRGKTTVRKIGMESVQRDDLDYAFDFVLALDNEHNGILQKTTARALAGKVFKEPGAEFAELVSRWLNSGEVPAERVRASRGAPTMSPAETAEAAAAVVAAAEAATRDDLLDDAIRQCFEDATTPDDLGPIVARIVALKLDKASPRRARLLALHAAAAKRVTPAAPNADQAGAAA